MKNNILNQNQKAVLIMGLFAFFTVAMWQTHIGTLILYPFTLLATWFHEMGHGITAMLLGATFHKLEIMPDGSGYAIHSGDLYLANIGRATVAAAGPILPSIIGALLIRAMQFPKYFKQILFPLGIILIVSDIFWIRSIFAFFLILLFGISTLYISFRANTNFQKYFLMFLGVQACLSVYQSISYLMTDRGIINGEQFVSDTGVISDSLFLPHWFWAILIILFSTYIFLTSLRKVYISSN